MLQVNPDIVRRVSNLVQCGKKKGTSKGSSVVDAARLASTLEGACNARLVRLVRRTRQRSSPTLSRGPGFVLVCFARALTGQLT